MKCPLPVLYDFFKGKPAGPTASLSFCNMHLSVCKHRTRGWMVESSQSGVLPGKNDRRSKKKVKEIEESNNNDELWALRCARKDMKTGGGC